MSESLLDKSLDEIIGDSSSGGGRSRRTSFRGSRGHRRGGSNRGGVAKSSRRGGGYRSNHHHGDSYIPESSTLNREIEQLSNGQPYLKITNLNQELTESDIHQLFSQVGQVLFCRVHVDTQGNSKGVAYVGFEDFNNNELAIEKFDGRRAAGQVISVKDVSKLNSSSKNPLFDRISIGSKTTARRHATTPRPKKKTAEELDAELDNYFQSTTTEQDDDNSNSNSNSKDNGDPNPPFPVV